MTKETPAVLFVKIYIENINLLNVGLIILADYLPDKV